MSEELVDLVCRCVNCGELNYYRSILCKKCGIVIIEHEYLCSGCEKLVQSEDEKCYSCGKKLEKAKIQDIEYEHSNVEEIEEKKKFFEELEKRIHGIEANYFMDGIRKSLDYYQTVKLLFSEECPKELAEYYEIENKGEMHEKLETIAKNFFNTLGGLILGEKYANVVTSIIAYFWVTMQFYELHDYKGLLVLLKTESRFYEEVLEFSEDKETFVYIYKKIITNTTLQDMIFNSQIDRGGVRTLRSGALFNLAEELNQNRKREPDTRKVAEEIEHLYISSINELIFAQSYYLEKDEGERAVKLAKKIKDRIINYGRLLKNYSIFKFTREIFSNLADTVGIIGRTLKEEEVKTIALAYKLLCEFIQEEEKEEKRFTSKSYTIHHAIGIIEKVSSRNLEMLLKLGMINDVFYIIGFKEEIKQDWIEKLIEELLQKKEENIKKLVMEQISNGLAKAYEKTNDNSIKEIIESL